MITYYYNREGKTVDRDEGLTLFEDPDYRVICQTMVKSRYQVSTVWLGLNHRFSNNGPPLIFETMIFGGHADEYQWRYATEDEALKNHARIVAHLKTGKPIEDLQ